MKKEHVDQTWYWKQKITSCRGELHRTIFDGPIDLVSQNEVGTRTFLEKEIQPTDSILDCGCGYGRLLYLLPENWQGLYLGVDFSPDMITLAKALHPSRSFVSADLRSFCLPPVFPSGYLYDVAVVYWVRAMVAKHLGEGEWSKMEANIKKYAKRILYLEGP